MAFKSLVLCLSSLLAHYPMLPTAPSQETSCKLQCAVHCSTWYVSFWDTQAERSWKPAFPFGYLIFATERTPTTLNLVSGDVKTKLSRLPQQLCSESTGCLVCSTPLLKIWRGTISSFIVFYSACRHSSTHLKKTLQQCTELSDWCRITRQQNTR